MYTLKCIGLCIEIHNVMVQTDCLVGNLDMMKVLEAEGTVEEEHTPGLDVQKVHAITFASSLV